MPFEVVREVPDAEVKASGPRFEVIGEVRPPRPRGPATIAEQLAEKAKARGTETPVLDTVETFADSLQRGVANVYTGAAKGAGNTLFGLGKLVRDYTPIGRVSDLISPGAFDTPPPELQPQGGLQRAGFLGEQVGEFFVPTGAVGKVGKAADVAKAALLTKAQTGSTGAAATSAALTAALPPVLGAAARLAPGLRASAEKTIAQALGATKEKWKDIAEKLAPQMLDRGVSGGRAGMLAQARAKVTAVGQLIEREVADQTAAGATVDGNKIRAAAQLASDALHVTDAAGQKIPILGTEVAIQRLKDLDDFASQLGPDIPFDKAQVIKQTWQHIVSAAGLYGPKATSTATDNAAADMFRKGAGVLREMLASGSATLDDLNREFGFWKGLKDVLKATEKRTQAQAVGLAQNIALGTGAATGALLGGPGGAGIGAVLSPMVIGAIRSPWFRTTAAAPLKNALAEALAKGDRGQLQLVAARIIAAMPSALRNATEP